MAQHNCITRKWDRRAPVYFDRDTFKEVSAQLSKDHGLQTRMKIVAHLVDDLGLPQTYAIKLIIKATHEPYREGEPTELRDLSY